MSTMSKRAGEEATNDNAKKPRLAYDLQDQLEKTANQIAYAGKGILAADESTGTIQKRFDGIGLENNEENRRAYRELLFGTTDIGNYVSGVILYEETLYQKAKDGKPFVKLLQERGIVPGIKVDQGLKPLPGTDEVVVQGLTDLDVRCKKYYDAGARFAKWRAAYQIDKSKGKPSHQVIKVQATDLARYAAVCQSVGLVPIVEPEVMMDGDHDIDTCAEVSEKVWSNVVKALLDHHVHLEGILLKPNMITPGQSHPNYKKTSPDTIAEYTLRILKRTIPPAVPGIMFLSGGQTEEEATLNLNAMNKKPTPWKLSFSYGRALQNSCLKTWKGNVDNLDAARKAWLDRAKANSDAQLGKYGGGAVGGTANETLHVKGYKY